MRLTTRRTCDADVARSAARPLEAPTARCDSRARGCPASRCTPNSTSCMPKERAISLRPADCSSSESAAAEGGMSYAVLPGVDIRAMPVAFLPAIKCYFRQACAQRVALYGDKDREPIAPLPISHYHGIGRRYMRQQLNHPRTAAPASTVVILPHPASHLVLFLGGLGLLLLSDPPRLPVGAGRRGEALVDLVRVLAVGDPPCALAHCLRGEG